MKITATHETSLLDLLQEAFPDSSTNKLKKVIRCGCIRYKNAVVKHPELLLQKGDSVEYTKYEAKRSFRERTMAPTTTAEAAQAERPVPRLTTFASK